MSDGNDWGAGGHPANSDQSSTAEDHTQASSSLAAVDGDMPAQLERAQRRLSFYENFDQIIQENIARSGDLLREAIDLRERSEAEMRRVREEALSTLRAERETQRSVFSNLLEEITTVQQSAERLARRVAEALDGLEAEIEPEGLSGSGLDRITATYTPVRGAIGPVDVPSDPQGEHPVSDAESTPQGVWGEPEPTPFATAAAGFEDADHVRDASEDTFLTDDEYVIERDVIAGDDEDIVDVESGEDQLVAEDTSDDQDEAESAEPEGDSWREDARSAHQAEDTPDEGAADDQTESDQGVMAIGEAVASPEAQATDDSSASDTDDSEIRADETASETESRDEAPADTWGDSGEASGHDAGEAVSTASPADYLGAAEFDPPAFDEATFDTITGSAVAEGEQPAPDEIEFTSDTGDEQPDFDQPAAEATTEEAPGYEDDERASDDVSESASPSESGLASDSVYAPDNLSFISEHTPEFGSPSDEHGAYGGTLTRTAVDTMTMTGESRPVMVLVHGVPRAATALSLQRYLSALEGVEGVEAREYTDGILRLQVSTYGSLGLDQLRAWEGGGELEPVHVHANVIEVKLPGADGF